MSRHGGDVKRMPWFKVHDDLFTSPSHAELDGDGLLTLIVIMSFVRAACDAAGDWTPWATLPTGKPISSTAIAARARKPITVVEKAIDQLVDAGTVARRDDGAIGLPGFQRHQQGESTERGQQLRARRAEVEAPSPPPGPQLRMSGEPTAEQRRVAHELELVREGLTYGWEGQPEPPRPRGLSRLRLHLKGVEALLASGMDAATLLDAVTKVAELVEVGELPRTDWTSTKVFSGYLDGMLVQHATWLEAKRRKEIAIAPAIEPAEPVVDAEYVESQTRALLAKIGGKS